MGIFNAVTFKTRSSSIPGAHKMWLERQSLDLLHFLSNLCSYIWYPWGCDYCDRCRSEMPRKEKKASTMGEVKTKRTPNNIMEINLNTCRWWRGSTPSTCTRGCMVSASSTRLLGLWRFVHHKSWPASYVLSHKSGDQEVCREADGHQGREDRHQAQQGHLGPGDLRIISSHSTLTISLLRVSGAFPSACASASPGWGTRTRTLCTSSTPSSPMSTSPRVASRVFRLRTLKLPSKCFWCLSLCGKVELPIKWRFDFVVKIQNIPSWLMREWKGLVILLNILGMDIWELSTHFFSP